MNNYYILAWSGGKDSALALNESLSSLDAPIKLLTTITEEYNRISMHGVRLELLRKQAEALGRPLDIVSIPKNCSDFEYQARMEQSFLSHKSAGCKGLIFGDIFLESVREYREKNLAQSGMEMYFPLWGKDSTALAHDFIKAGFKAVITCVDSQVLGEEFVGRMYDEDFLKDLPLQADPCGENGEFHTFVFDGPIFKYPVYFVKGEIELREKRFYYCDLKEY